ncbi:MAG: hypothetical protein RLZZ385_2219 [Pseudomonadota bacterium]|jgi:predicted esterase
MPSKRLISFAALVLLLLSPGLQSAEQLLTLDDQTTIKVFVFVPEEAGPGPWPLAVLMPGGQGHEYIARAQFWLGKELADRGWVIAVPVSPDKRSFFGESGAKIPKVIAALQANESIRPGKSLLVGVSTGGSSALEIASKHPGDYLGVVAVPGRIKQTDELPPLMGLPVFLRVAENDYFRWHKLLPEMLKRLEAAGARVDAALVPGARHTFKINWEELDPWLKSLK